jgi:type I restriction enzyme R subunit
VEATGYRKALLSSLAEKGYGNDQLAEIRRMIDAEKSDLYDVLTYIAFALVPISREERVITNRDKAFAGYGEKQREFLDFVLDQYIKEGVQELDDEKLPDLLELKYDAVSDAVDQLGSVAKIREVFVGFQRHLYSERDAA